jgi:hypothetical protein
MLKPKVDSIDLSFSPLIMLSHLSLCSSWPGLTTGTQKLSQPMSSRGMEFDYNKWILPIFLSFFSLLIVPCTSLSSPFATWTHNLYWIRKCASNNGVESDSDVFEQMMCSLNKSVSRKLSRWLRNNLYAPEQHTDMFVIINKIKSNNYSFFISSFPRFHRIIGEPEAFLVDQDSLTQLDFMII